MLQSLRVYYLPLQTEHSYKGNPKLLSQLQYCEDTGVPFAVILGESEIQNNVVKLREVSTRAEVYDQFVCSRALEFSVLSLAFWWFFIY